MDHRCKLRAFHPASPMAKELSSGGYIRLIPQPPQMLLERPGLGRLEVLGLEPFKALVVLLRQVFLAPEPHLARASQRLILPAAQFPVLALPDAIQRLVQV